MPTSQGERSQLFLILYWACLERGDDDGNDDYKHGVPLEYEPMPWMQMSGWLGAVPSWTFLFPLPLTGNSNVLRVHVRQIQESVCIPIHVGTVDDDDSRGKVIKDTARRILLDVIPTKR